MTVRALLDSGVEESFLTEYVAQALSLRKKSIQTVVSGVGGENTANSSNFSFEFSALVLKRLTVLLPRLEVVRQPWPHLDGFQVADPHYRNAIQSGLYSEQRRLRCGPSAGHKERPCWQLSRTALCFWLGAHGLYWSYFWEDGCMNSSTSRLHRP